MLMNSKATIKAIPYVKALERKNLQQVVLWLVIIGLLATNAYLGHQLVMKPNWMRHYYITGLTPSFTTMQGGPSNFMVFDFAQKAYQHIWDWPKDGAKEAYKRIEEMTKYSSAGWRRQREEVIQKIKDKGFGTLKNRTSSFALETASRWARNRVHKIGDNQYKVRITGIVEHEQDGTLLLKQRETYEVTVQYRDIDPEKNLYALQLINERYISGRDLTL